MASGLVLGVGAAVTLAAWSDTVWGRFEFGTGDSSFNVQGSFDGGTTWGGYLTAGAAGTMTFAQKADALIPAQPVYQLVGLHEVEDNFGANIAVTKTNADTSALANLVTVRVAALTTTTTSSAPTCDGTADFGTGTTIGAASTKVLDTTVTRRVSLVVFLR